jgi:hypothetical protein
MNMSVLASVGLIVVAVILMLRGHTNWGCILLIISLPLTFIGESLLFTHAVICGLLIFAWTKTHDKFQSFIGFVTGLLILIGVVLWIAQIYHPNTAAIDFLKKFFDSEAAIIAFALGIFCVFLGIGFESKLLNISGAILLVCWIGSPTWTAIFGRMPVLSSSPMAKGVKDLVGGLGAQAERVGESLKEDARKKTEPPPKPAPTSSSAAVASVAPHSPKWRDYIGPESFQKGDWPRPVSFVPGRYLVNSNSQVKLKFPGIEEWANINGEFEFRQERKAHYFCHPPCTMEIKKLD